MVRSHIQPVVALGSWPPVTVARLPSAVRRRVPYFRAAALTQRWPAGSQNRWLRVVSITAVPYAVRTLRSYLSVSWWTRTAVTVSGLVFPVLVLVAMTLSPTLSLLIGTRR